MTRHGTPLITYLSGSRLSAERLNAEFAFVVVWGLLAMIAKHRATGRL